MVKNVPSYSTVSCFTSVITSFWLLGQFFREDNYCLLLLHYVFSLNFAEFTTANFALFFKMLTLYFTVAVVLVMTVVMVMSLPETFKRAYINESAPILKPAYPVRGVGECGVTCTDLSYCFGFMFDNSVKRCTLLGCFNPGTSNGGKLSYLLPMSKLLARGKNTPWC